MGRKITILGMGPSAHERRHDIERYVDGTEIWSLNNGYGTFPTLREGKKFNRFFEMHAWQYLKDWKAGQLPTGEQINHWAALNELQCPVYTGQPLPYVEQQTLIDWKQLGMHYKSLFEQISVNLDIKTGQTACYFRGSPSLMLMIALMEHDNGNTIEYIQSYGIDTSDPQHQCQRPSWSFWLSQALARGIKLGGTACRYMFDVENDAGLVGLQQRITNLTRE